MSGRRASCGVAAEGVMSSSSAIYMIMSQSVRLSLSYQRGCAPPSCRRCPFLNVCFSCTSTPMLPCFPASLLSASLFSSFLSICFSTRLPLYLLAFLLSFLCNYLNSNVTIFLLNRTYTASQLTSFTVIGNMLCVCLPPCFIASA